MASFPDMETKVSTLATDMLAGYDMHAADFPSADATGLMTVFQSYLAAHTAHVDADAAARVATEDKNAALTALEAMMHTELKKSEVDVASDPEKLEYIGWGPRTPPSPIDPPGPPQKLDPIVQGPGIILLKWKFAPRHSGGTTRTYIIERRDEPSGGGEFGEWTQVGVAIETETTLREQPRGIQMEYRVKGINTGGESVPSNVAPVVL